MARWSCFTTLLRYRRAYFHRPPAAIFLTEQSQASKGCLIPVKIDLVRQGTPSWGDGRTKSACADSIFLSLQSRDATDFPSCPLRDTGSVDRHGRLQPFHPFAMTNPAVARIAPTADSRRNLPLGSKAFGVPQPGIFVINRNRMIVEDIENVGHPRRNARGVTEKVLRSIATALPTQ